MNSFDTIHFRMTIPKFDTSFVQCEMVELANFNELTHQRTPYVKFVIKHGHGLSSVTAPLYYDGMKLDGESVTIKLNVSSKILGKYHANLINRETIHLLLEQLQERLYVGLTMEMLTSSIVDIIHVTKDLECDTSSIDTLHSLRFTKSTNLHSLSFPKNNNITFTNGKKKEYDNGLYLTFYNKYDSLKNKDNKQFRIFIDDDYSDKKNVYRIETKLNGHKQIRQRLTNDKRYNDDFDSHKIEPTLEHCLQSDVPTLFYDLSYIIENTIDTMNLKHLENDTERFLIKVMESYDFDKKQARAYLIEQFGMAYYKRHYQKELNGITEKCISKKRTYLHTIREELEF